jgi:hypothetical protein
VKSVILREAPVASAVRRFEETGQAIVVRQGGGPGVRLFLDSPHEDYPGQRSFAVHRGAVIAREFSRLFLSFPTIVDTGVPVELEVFTCAPPVAVIGADQWLNGVLYVGGANGVACPALDDVTLYTEAIRPEEETQLDRWFTQDKKFIGGCLRSTTACSVFAWQRIDSGRRARIAQLNIEVVDPDGFFSVSFEAGWGRLHDSTGSGVAVRSHGPLLPWPRRGLELTVLNNDTLTAASIDWLLYARNA